MNTTFSEIMESATKKERLRQEKEARRHEEDKKRLSSLPEWAHERDPQRF